MKGQYLKTAIAACLIMSTMIAGTVTFGFFMEPVTADLGFERASFSIYFSIISVVGAITLPFYGKIITKYGTRPMVIICGAWTALAMAALSLCKSLVAFYAVGVLVGLGFFGCSYAVVPVIVATWFIEKNGAVMGAASTVGGCAGIIASLVFPNIINAFSWHAGYIAMGIMVAIFTLPAGIFLLRSKPEDVGLIPLGADKIQAEEGGADFGMTMGEALKTPQLWACLLAFMLFAMTAMCTQHLPAHFVGLGFSSTMAGFFMSVMSAGVLVTSIIAGAVADKIGPSKSVLIFSIVYAAAFAIFPALRGVLVISFFLILLSICNVNMTIFSPLVTSAVFGPKDYAAIWGLGSMANVVGQAVGTPLYGLVFDLTGSYTFAMYGSAAAIIIACILVLSALKSVKKAAA